MIHHLSIDLETYSEAPIAKTGALRYIADPSFEILLFAYSLDGGEVKVIDMANGETLPSWLQTALISPGYIKHAYNAPFEFGCLSRYFGPLHPSQWRCTMMHGLYCGFPAGLDTVGKALGLPEDKQKLSTGKALIRYFCIPCKPTKTNGYRARNYPHHDPEKWELFKEYCMQDVVTEMEVEKRMASIATVPDKIQKQWETDLRINMRGVAVDMNLVDSAIRMGESATQEIMAEAVEITGLANPNSVGQLKDWLGKEIGTDEEITGLTKDTVKKLLNREGNSQEVQRMLQIRQELGKTSTKKYNAIRACVCPDGRVHGLLQFYGANRSGRWAGRLVQVQNLPRTYLEPLGFARELVKEQKMDAVKLIYGSVQDTLSQLIRTAFVAAPGNVLIDADFSAIEARVISWLADEKWRLDVFRTHGKIYEASASQMFSVPIELIQKGNPEYELRAKGKVAELALGYQGGPAALVAMGALDMGLTEEELPDIVNRWRTANSHIRDLWYEMNDALIDVIQNGTTRRVKYLILRREHNHTYGLTYLTIELPSGRKIYYISPSLGENRFGGVSITYMGINQTSKKWQIIETYGGKVVENVTQAIARDCLAEAVERLEAAGFPIVFHVHDEVVIDVHPYTEPEIMLHQVEDLMKQPVSWAPGLPLGAAGWVGDFFTKD